VRLRDEVKEKDEKIRSLIKGLLKYDKGERVSAAEVAEMRELVIYIGSVEQLNTQLGQSRDEAFQLRREIKDTLNKKSATELKNSELRNEISNLLLRGERKEEEKVALQQRIEQLQTDLASEKDSSKRLEHYYEVKWHGEFERVKSHLERAY
jgi:regulator of replication initiation timing